MRYSIHLATEKSLKELKSKIPRLPDKESDAQVIEALDSGVRVEVLSEDLEEIRRKAVQEYNAKFRANSHYMLEPASVNDKGFPYLDDLCTLYIRHYLVKVSYDAKDIALSRFPQQWKKHCRRYTRYVDKLTAKSILKVYPQLKDSIRHLYKYGFQLHVLCTETWTAQVYSTSVQSGEYIIGDPQKLLNGSTYKKLQSKPLYSKTRPCDTERPTWDARKRWFIDLESYYLGKDWLCGYKLVVKHKEKKLKVLAFPIGDADRSVYTVYDNQECNCTKYKTKSKLVALIPTALVEDKTKLKDTYTIRIQDTATCVFLSNGNIVIKDNQNKPIVEITTTSFSHKEILK